VSIHLFMKQEAANIMVFKTNIDTMADVTEVQYILEGHCHIAQWSVDTEDADKVLRIASYTLKEQDIIQMITNRGYQCADMDH